jgi:co-chaperonin GroES (HSP10)
MKIIPRNDYVLVEILSVADKSAGGVLLPETTKDKRIFKPAKILGIGGLVNATKERIPPGATDRDRNLLAVGSIVLVNGMAAASVDPQNEAIKLLHEEDVVANVE